MAPARVPGVLALRHPDPYPRLAADNAPSVSRVGSGVRPWTPANADTGPDESTQHTSHTVDE
jgi:hypothetical protein